LLIDGLNQETEDSHGTDQRIKEEEAYMQQLIGAIMP
jgi:hypothetical protein